jgi:hypothetical protein
LPSSFKPDGAGTHNSKKQLSMNAGGFDILKYEDERIIMGWESSIAKQ